MTIYEVLLWMLAYCFGLLLAAMAINGLHMTTRGETETLPDGSEGKINDMIFYPLLQLVKKEKGKKRIYYSGDQLQRLVRRILKKMPLTAPDYISVDAIRYTDNKSVAMIKYWVSTATEWLEEEDIFMETGNDESGNNGFIRFYKEYPIYYLPKYVRKPLLECIKCMASVWGTLIYWPFVLSLFSFDIIMIPIWVLFCFSLSWLNTFLYQKAN